ncbi:MAG: PIG-L family deacetylase [Blastopirellula sp.]|nr:PIG-L family deacetylase [Blastopirellula sp.]
MIAVGAHPDDVEIGCGGTLAALVDAGYSVGIIDLTDGEPTPVCPSPEVRLAEAAAAAQVLGVAVRLTLPLPNRALFDSFEARVALAREFRKHRPRLVIGLGNRTPMASPDHWQARQIIDAAVFYSRLTKWDHHFAGYPPHKIDRQYYYHLSFDLDRLNDPELFGPAVIQDISATLERKLAAVRCYETQFPPTKQDIYPRVINLARTLGQSVGVEAGERLVGVRPILTRDLLAT